MSDDALRLDVDSDRSGSVQSREVGSADWTWGADGRGAIAIVDCDGGDSPSADTTEIRLVVDHDRDDRVVYVSIDSVGKNFVRLWAVNPDGSAHAKGGLLDTDAPAVEAFVLPWQSTTLRLQALSFPTAAFDGFVEIIAATALKTDNSALRAPVDRAIVRVAPWIMPSTLRPPEEVYVVDAGTGVGGNVAFKDGLSQACTAAGVPLKQVTPQNVRGADRWIQDEIEIGYTQSPTSTKTVILDGPRDRELDGVAQAQLATKDISVWNIHPHLFPTSLDSFGNLEVSPPVQTGGVDYGLGRIVMGTKKPLDEQGRKSSLTLRQFLYNQRVQAPLEIYTDWLYVGHVDEIISFVPDESSSLGFRILYSSPKAFRDLLDELNDTGHGDAVFWEGKRRVNEKDGSLGPQAQRTVTQLLTGNSPGRDNPYDFAFNEECEAKVAAVRQQLMDGLGVGQDAFYPVASGFKQMPGREALAYFPGMVNHLVLGPVSVVPNPYGPTIDGVDPLKESFLAAVGSRREGVRFIDDWLSYHEQMGEVHCGTNVRRTPDAQVRWWELKVPGTYDANIKVEP